MRLRTGREMSAARALGAVVAGAALAMAGCNADYTENSQAPVLLQITSVNESAQLDSDVRNGEFSTFVCEDDVDVAVRVVLKNPNTPGSVASDVLLDSYEIKYIRSDGRGTEGVDVPYRITGPLAVLVESEGEATFALEVVRRQAKLDPPLTNIQQTTILTVTAQITLFGKTTSEKRVTTTGSLQIDFADFGDEETSCPQN